MLEKEKRQSIREIIISEVLPKTPDIAAEASFDVATVPYLMGVLLQRIVTAVKVHISRVSTKTSKMPKSP